MAFMNQDVVDAAGLIDEQPIGMLLMRPAILCSMVAFLVGMDTTSVSVAAPLVAESLHLTKSEVGLMFSAGLLGSVVGTPVLGLLADRSGRKRILLLSTLVFGVFTLLTALAHSFGTLLLVRFLAGVGLGGATPCFIALATEYAPRRYRAVVASLVWTAFPVGANLGAFIDAVLISRFEWQSIFLVGGAVPMIILLFLVIWLPESLRFLILENRRPAEIRRIVSRILPGLKADTRIVTSDPELPGLSLSTLFSDGRARQTLLFGVLFFVAIGTSTTLFSWATTLMGDHGIPIQRAAVALGFGGLGMLIGAPTAGRLINRFGAVAVLVPALLLGAVATIALSYAAASILWMTIDLMLGSVMMSGLGVSSGLALAATYYPTAMRSTGIGWAMGMGGVGQVLLLMLTGSMMNAGVQPGTTFEVLAVAPVIGAAAVLLMGWNRASTGKERRRFTPRSEGSVP